MYVSEIIRIFIILLDEGLKYGIKALVNSNFLKNQINNHVQDASELTFARLTSNRPLASLE